jgi:hypothetical protein
VVEVGRMAASPPTRLTADRHGGLSHGGCGLSAGSAGRGLLGSWPQADVGIVLWSLSVSAGDWQTSEKLTRLCTIPEPATLAGTWDRSAYAMEARILRPLLWFDGCYTAAKKSPIVGSLHSIIIARQRCSRKCPSYFSAHPHCAMFDP